PFEAALFAEDAQILEPSVKLDIVSTFTFFLGRACELIRLLAEFHLGRRERAMLLCEPVFRRPRKRATGGQECQQHGRMGDAFAQNRVEAFHPGLCAIRTEKRGRSGASTPAAIARTPSEERSKGSRVAMTRHSGFAPRSAANRRTSSETALWSAR